MPWQQSYGGGGEAGDLYSMWTNTDTGQVSMQDQSAAAQFDPATMYGQMQYNQQYNDGHSDGVYTYNGAQLDPSQVAAANNYEHQAFLEGVTNLVNNTPGGWQNKLAAVEQQFGPRGLYFAGNYAGQMFPNDPEAQQWLGSYLVNYGDSIADQQHGMLKSAIAGIAGMAVPGIAGPWLSAAGGGGITGGALTGATAGAVSGGITGGLEGALTGAGLGAVGGGIASGLNLTGGSVPGAEGDMFGNLNDYNAGVGSIDPFGGTNLNLGGPTDGTGTSEFGIDSAFDDGTGAGPIDLNNLPTGNETYGGTSGSDTGTGDNNLTDIDYGIGNGDTGLPAGDGLTTETGAGVPFNWDSIPWKELFGGMFTLYGLNVNENNMEDLINAINSQSDPAAAWRPFYQQEFNKIYTDPNYLTNNTTFQGMLDQATTATNNKLAALGYNNSGNQGHELMKTGMNTAGNFLMPWAQMTGAAGGLMTAPQNVSLANTSLGMALNNNNMQQYGTAGDVLTRMLKNLPSGGGSSTGTSGTGYSDTVWGA